MQGDRPLETSPVRPSQLLVARLKRAICKLWSWQTRCHVQNILRRMLAPLEHELTTSSQVEAATMAVRGLALCSSATCKQAPRQVQPSASSRPQPPRVSSPVRRAAQWAAAAACPPICPRRSRHSWAFRTSCSEQLSIYPPPSLPPAVNCSSRRRASPVCTRAGAVAAPPAAAPAISISDQALTHLHKLRAEHGKADLILRIGVKSGGCSGMSYHMDFESADNVSDDDNVMSYDGAFQLVCDSKSLLYLFGLRLDYRCGALLLLISHSEKGCIEHCSLCSSCRIHALRCTFSSVQQCAHWRRISVPEPKC